MESEIESPAPNGRSSIRVRAVLATGKEITLYENLKDLLAVSDEGRCSILRNYRKMHWDK